MPLKPAAGRPVGVGIVGCGRIAVLRHFPALAGVRDARVVAVADADPGRLESVAERFGVARRCLDPLELVADPVVDVVAVCVPAESHAGVAIAALEAGKHVLVEKPLCLALDDADRLARAAEQSAGTVMVAFNLRWHRLARKAREVVRSGVLGKIDAVRTVWSSSFDHRSDVGTWRRERRSGGGVLLEIGPHHFDLVRFLLEDELVEVAAFSRSGPWEDEAAVVTARTAGGVLVSAVLSQRSVNDNELEIFGTAGRLRLSFYRHDGFEVVASPAFPAGLGNRLRRAVVGAATLPVAVIGANRGGDYVATYRTEWRHFLGAVRDGRLPECTLEDGRRNLELLLAATASAERRVAVKVADAPRSITAPRGGSPP